MGFTFIVEFHVNSKTFDLLRVFKFHVCYVVEGFLKGFCFWGEREVFFFVFF